MSLDEYKGLVIAIPTRNRSALAMNAIKSIVEQNIQDVYIVISDNSTETKEQENLLHYCEHLKSDHIRYLRPPQALPMTEHWEYLMQTILKEYNVNHFTYLTDRFIFKKNSLKIFKQLIQKYNSQVITYAHDTLDDTLYPMPLLRHAGSNYLLEVYSGDFLKHFSECNFINFAIPKMMNSVVPRSVLNAIYKKNGFYFQSIAPDYCFGFQYLANYETFLCLDTSLTLSYGLKESNGSNTNRGRKNKYTIDFLKNISNLGGLAYAAPIPEIIYGENAIVSEYLIAKNHTNSKKFPPIHMNKYMDMLWNGMQHFENLEEKQKNINILKIKSTQLEISLLPFKITKESHNFIFFFQWFLKKTRAFFLSKEKIRSLISIIEKKCFLNRAMAFWYLKCFPFAYGSNKSHVEKLISKNGRILNAIELKT